MTTTDSDHRENTGKLGRADSQRQCRLMTYPRPTLNGSLWYRGFIGRRCVAMLKPSSAHSHYVYGTTSSTSAWEPTLSRPECGRLSSPLMLSVCPTLVQFMWNVCDMWPQLPKVCKRLQACHLWSRMSTLISGAILFTASSRTSLISSRSEMMSWFHGVGGIWCTPVHYVGAVQSLCPKFSKWVDPIRRIGIPKFAWSGGRFLCWFSSFCVNWIIVITWLRRGLTVNWFTFIRRSIAFVHANGSWEPVFP